jgi:3-isopropylmalate/(R)-2-methylmalate dehydratase small subunit
MASFKRVTSHAVRLLIDNIDTDQIIPARYLKITDKRGLGDLLFHDWRYAEDGTPRPEFALNKPDAQGAELLLAGDNFGCGSSREHAPWALYAWGLRAVISTSFADIFRGNSLKNGLLPVEVDRATHARLIELLERDPAAKLTVDLETQTLSLPDGTNARFPVDSFSRHCLLNGLDELGYIQSFDSRIQAYEASHHRQKDAP